jgi:type VI secretion system protein ImpE
MDAETLLASGDVQGSLESLQDSIRKTPSDPKLRVFLFQLLSVLGQWDRAHTQLNVAAEMDPQNLVMAQMYREALRCEVLREKVFRGETTPLIFGDPEEWIAHLMESFRLTATGNVAESGDLRNRAFEAAPTTPGTRSPGTEEESRFAWIADADMRLGPMLEAIVKGQYYWVPFHRIHRINIEAPEDLRDMVWLPAQFTWANGGQAVGLVPTRYCGSAGSEDSAIRLARRTDWAEMAADVYAGLGQRILTTDGGDIPLLDLRTIEFDTLEGDEAVDG